MITNALQERRVQRERAVSESRAAQERSEAEANERTHALQAELDAQYTARRTELEAAHHSALEAIALKLEVLPQSPLDETRIQRSRPLSDSSNEFERFQFQF